MYSFVYVLMRLTSLVLKQQFLAHKQKNIFLAAIYALGLLKNIENKKMILTNRILCVTENSILGIKYQ